MDGGFLRNIGNETNDHDSCVEIAGAGDTEEQMHASKLKDGAKIHLDICELGSDQRWSLEGGRLRNGIGDRKCLQVKPPAVPTATSGHGLWIRNCAEQLGVMWERTVEGQLRSPDGKRCIGIAEDGMGVTPEASACSDSDTTMIAWDLLSGGYIIEQMSRDCLGYVGDMSSRTPLPLQVQPCIEDNGGLASAHQRWVFEGGIIRSSVSPVSCIMAKGDELFLSTMCPGVYQRFEFAEFSHIWNKATGLCLDAEKDEGPGCSVYKDKTAGCASLSPLGWKLTMAQCDPLRGLQHWEAIDP
mmetsp:Transcript_63897/g.176591  ORF Transcript_63897/g.176591 Transcript_63897/m.176591 type:complete len:299 (-) Transcript_63897:298-1194(-)